MKTYSQFSFTIFPFPMSIIIILLSLQFYSYKDSLYYKSEKIKD